MHWTKLQGPWLACPDCQGRTVKWRWSEQMPEQTPLEFMDSAGGTINDAWRAAQKLERRLERDNPMMPLDFARSLILQLVDYVGEHADKMADGIDMAMEAWIWVDASLEALENLEPHRARRFARRALRIDPACAPAVEFIVRVTARTGRRRRKIRG